MYGDVAKTDHATQLFGGFAGIQAGGGKQIECLAAILRNPQAVLTNYVHGQVDSSLGRQGRTPTEYTAASGPGRAFIQRCFPLGWCPLC